MTVRRDRAVFGGHVDRALLGIGSAIAVLLCNFSHGAQAASFEIGVAPSRFEVTVVPGQRLGQSLDIYNVGAGAAEVSLRTIDWSFSEDGKLEYHDELKAGSCRPWVTLERRTLKIAARGKSSFRFQIDVPRDTPRGECRLMLAIEGVEPAYKALIEGGSASLSLPVSGRIAVPIYAAIGGAQPQLELLRVDSQVVSGKRRPYVIVINRGDAHGRLEGDIEATDRSGRRLILSPDGTPILPGQTRRMDLNVRTEDSKPGAADLVYPLQLDGLIEWDRGAFKINARLVE